MQTDQTAPAILRLIALSAPVAVRQSRDPFRSAVGLCCRPAYGAGCGPTVRCRGTRTLGRAGEPPEWISPPPVGNPGWGDRCSDPEAAQGDVFPGVSGTPPRLGKGYDGVRHCLSDQWRSNGSLQEAYIQGVSTRSVDDLVKAMGMTGVSKSQVSRLCVEIDERVDAFLDRPLEGGWPYLWLDATYIKVRRSGRIVSVAAIVAVAVNLDGRREVLGIAIQPSAAACTSCATRWPVSARRTAQ